MPVSDRHPSKSHARATERLSPIMEEESEQSGNKQDPPKSEYLGFVEGIHFSYFSIGSAVVQWIQWLCRWDIVMERNFFKYFLSFSYSLALLSYPEVVKISPIYIKSSHFCTYTSPLLLLITELATSLYFCFIAS